MGGMISGIGQAWLGTEQAIDDSKTAVHQGEAEQAAATYNARMAERKGALDSAKIRMQGSQLVEKQKTAYAGSGVDPTSGTAASVMEDTRLMSELDAKTAENDAARAAWGYRLQREQSKANTETKLATARRQQYASILGGIGQFTSGAMSASSSFGGGGGGGGGGG